MNQQKIRLVIKEDFACNAFDFILVGYDESGDASHVASPFVMEPYRFDDIMAGPPDPSFRLDHRKCQELADRLWDIGVKPTQSYKMPESLNQANAHIETLKEMNSFLVKALEANAKSRTVVPPSLGRFRREGDSQGLRPIPTQQEINEVLSVCYLAQDPEGQTLPCAAVRKVQGERCPGTGEDCPSPPRTD